MDKPPMAAFRNTHDVNTDNLISIMVLGYEGYSEAYIERLMFGYTKD